MRENILSQDLLDSAKQVLYGNLKIGFSRWAGTDYKYVSPSRLHYPHQWFWDSCFHTIVLSHLDIDLAKNEIRNLLKGQLANGFIPHIIFWDRRGLAQPWEPLESKPSLAPKTTQLMQPPLLAEAVAAIYQKDKDWKFLKEVLPKVAYYYRRLAETRDPDGDGLISIIAPYESGMDQSPSYDPILGVSSSSAISEALMGRTVTFRNMMRAYNLEKIFAADYFNVEDVLVNSIYIRNLNILTNLLQEIDREDEARYFHKLAIKAKQSLIENCYDRQEGFFYDRFGKDHQYSRVKTVKGLMPLILDLPKTITERLVKKHLTNKDEFDLSFPIPTVARNEPSFSAQPPMLFREPIIWRGPTWINTNWYLWKGLEEHGYKKEAESIKEVSIDLIRRNGFREFFNPLTGEGYGTHNFSWSTLVVDMLLS